MTFALTEFFQIMADFDDAHDSGLITKVEDICLQIDLLYDEWKIVSIHKPLDMQVTPYRRKLT